MSTAALEQTQVDIAIIGAGIGGTAAAIALQQAGFVVDVFEQAPQMGEVGGAIVIRETSMALFAKWGVLDQLQASMVAIKEIERRDSDGTVLGAVPIGFGASNEALAYCMHRADIMAALMSKMSSDRVHLGHHLKSIENRADHAEATFANGRCVTARLIIGADGLRSVVRAKLDTTPMTFLNKVTHRTIAPASLLPPELPNDRIRMWERGEQRLMLLPLRNGSEVAISAPLPADKPPEELWGATSANDLLALYADFDPVVLQLIGGRIVDITTHPIYDKDPIDRWVDRRIVLLGDAAHPMAPMNGQGANQAIQDGDVLATALAKHGRDNLAAALDEYQLLRIPVASYMQQMSRKPPQVDEKRPRTPA